MSKRNERRCCDAPTHLSCIDFENCPRRTVRQLLARKQRLFGKLRPLLKFRNPGANVAHVWHDQQLEAGHRWHDEIQAALKEMNIFVCLVSYEFLASDYIMNVELKEALRREKKKEIAIVPILLYRSTWTTIALN